MTRRQGTLPLTWPQSNECFQLNILLIYISNVFLVSWTVSNFLKDRPPRYIPYFLGDLTEMREEDISCNSPRKWRGCSQSYPSWVGSSPRLWSTGSGWQCSCQSWTRYIYRCSALHPQSSGLLVAGRYSSWVDTAINQLKYLANSCFWKDPF